MTSPTKSINKDWFNANGINDILLIMGNMLYGVDRFCEIFISSFKFFYCVSNKIEI